MSDITLTINGEIYDCVPRKPRGGTPCYAPVAYSQRNPHWAHIALGASRYTIGSAGCAVTAVAMLGTLAEPSLTPGILTIRLGVLGGFTSDGLLYWQKAAYAVDGLEWLDYRKWPSENADMDYVRSALERGPQIVQVDFKPKTSPLDTHFVLGLAMTEDGEDIDIIDPWAGQRGTLLGLYAQPGWDLARAIYALAEFRVS